MAPWATVRIFYITSRSALSVLLVVYKDHTPAHGCYVKSTVLRCRTVSDSRGFLSAAAWIPLQLANTFPALCSCHTWAAFIFPVHCAPQTQTQTLTHAHRRLCTWTHFSKLAVRKKDFTVLSLSRSHYFFPCFTVLCSRMCVAADHSRRNTYTDTPSSNRNVAILQSHFQLCFSEFCIRGEICSSCLR